MATEILIEQKAYQALIGAGMPREQILNVLRGHMSERTNGELDRIVQFRDDDPETYGSLVTLFEFKNVYKKYTMNYRREQAIALFVETSQKAEKSAKDQIHKKRVQENIRLNKESRKILKGGR